MRGIFDPLSILRSKLDNNPSGITGYTGPLLHFLHFSEYSNLLNNGNVNVSKVTWPNCVILPNISVSLGDVLTRSSRAFRLWSNPSLEPQTFTWFHKDCPAFLCHTWRAFGVGPNSVIMIYLPRKIFIRWDVPRLECRAQFQAIPLCVTASGTLFRSTPIRCK
jgi:hypothetical protein